MVEDMGPRRIAARGHRLAGCRPSGRPPRRCAVGGHRTICGRIIEPPMPRREPPSAAPSARRLDRDCDVLICGASFAGLAVARELAGTRRRVMVIDRYEIGERQTSACGIPTELAARARPDRGAAADLRRAGASTPRTRRVRYELPWTFSTFDYRTLCGAAGRPGLVRVRDRQGRSRVAATSWPPTAARSARR